MTAPDSQRGAGDVFQGRPPQKSFIRLDPDTPDEEREAQIMDWLDEIMGPPSDGGDQTD